MADRTLTVRILGDSRSLTREFARSSGAARRFNRDIDRTFRGVVAGSGAFRSLGRSVAFASTSFLGAAGLGAAVAGAFGELAESRRVTAQTNAALRSTGAIAGVTARHVEELGNALLRKTGIDDEAIRSAENLLLTFTNVRNNVGAGNDVFDQATKAILDMSVAMGGDLEGATIRVGKALQDPIRGATALRRVGVQLTEAQEKQIKAFVRTGRTMDAQRIILRELEREFGGSAAAAGNVQPWNLLRETIRNLGAELAGRLLPNIQNVVGRLQDWFDNAENQKRVTDDVTGAVKKFAAIVKTAADAAKRFSDFVGGWENALSIAAGAFVGFKTIGIASAIAVQTANIVAAGVTASAWRAALLATGWGAFAVAAGIAAGLVMTHWTRVKVFLEQTWIAIKVGALQAVAVILEAFSHVPGQLGRDASAARDQINANIAGLRDDFRALGEEVGDRFWEGFRASDAKNRKQTFSLDPGMHLPGRRGLLGASAEPPPGGGGAGGLTASQRNTFFDNALSRSLSRVQDLGLNDQLRRLREVSRLITARIAVTKDITRKLTLEDRLVDVRRQIKSVQEQIADNLIASSERARKKIEDARVKMQQTLEAIRVARNARQFRALGLTATGDEPVPGVKALRSQLSRLGDVVKGTFLDTNKTKGLLAGIRRVLSGGLGAVGRDVRSKIQQILADLDQQLKDHSSKTNLTKFRKADTDKILAGLGLSPEQLREARSRISRIGAGGTVAGRGSGAFGTAVTGGNGNIVITGPLTIKADNPDAFMRELQKRAQRAPAQRGGRTPGVGMGLG